MFGFFKGVVVALNVQTKPKNKDFAHRQTLHLENIIDIHVHAARSIILVKPFFKFAIKYPINEDHHRNRYQK